MEPAGFEPATHVVPTAFAPKFTAFNRLKNATTRFGETFFRRSTTELPRPFYGAGGRIRTGDHRITCSFSRIRRERIVTTKFDETYFTRSTAELRSRLLEPVGLEPTASSLSGM